MSIGILKINQKTFYTNLEATIKEIKHDNVQNTALQNCRASPIAGGAVDMLLGIKYISIFHTLPSGLTIYESKLASHDGCYQESAGTAREGYGSLPGAVQAQENDF